MLEGTKEYTVRVTMAEGEETVLTVFETIGIKTTIINIVRGENAERLYINLVNNKR